MPLILVLKERSCKAIVRSFMYSSEFWTVDIKSEQRESVTEI